MGDCFGTGYLLLNLAITDDATFGMVLDVGNGLADDPIAKFASAAQGEAVDGPITYATGPLTLSVIPEPGSLLTLIAGTLVYCRRLYAVGPKRQPCNLPPSRATSVETPDTAAYLSAVVRVP